MSHRQLSAEGLEVAFGHRQVLRGADLEIPRGRRLALLGANGSGKTTLLRALAGSVKPGHGNVLVDGAAVGVCGQGAGRGERCGKAPALRCGRPPRAVRRIASGARRN